MTSPHVFLIVSKTAARVLCVQDKHTCKNRFQTTMYSDRSDFGLTTPLASDLILSNSNGFSLGFRDQGE
jgi:hypothetical protein